LSPVPPTSMASVRARCKGGRRFESERRPGVAVSRVSVSDGTLDEWKAFFTEANDAHGTFSFSLDPPMK